MTISRSALAARARAYAASMTSIRGRRVQRLVMRELAGFDAVVPATSGEGRPALVAVRAAGEIAVCCTDGTGRAATVVRGDLAAATVETGYDLHKDSLPVVVWTVRHPGLPAGLAPLTIDASGLPASESQAVAGLFARHRPRRPAPDGGQERALTRGGE